VGIYLFTHKWFDIQQVLVVHVVLRSGYLFIYTGMVINNHFLKQHVPLKLVVYQTIYV
jgi:hypothetical protein